MTDSYLLRRNSIGPQVAVNISAKRYEELRGARLTLIDAGAFEYRYELLIGNYLAFEKFGLEWSLRDGIESDFSYGRWANVMIEANRHVMNLLTAGRTYVDHVAQDFKHLGLSPSFKEQAKKLTNNAYDTALAYKFICKLRNYVQHQNMPVHRISPQLRNGPEGIAFNCLKKELKGEGFSDELLKQLDDAIDLRQMAREYMNVVSDVHVELRALVNPSVEQARRLHEEAITEFTNAQTVPEQGTPGLGLSICRVDGDDFVDVHPILLDWDRVRESLAHKNRYRLKL